MISLPVIFFIFIFFFALIGGLRGWAKELLVSFSVVLALFLILILQNYIHVVLEPFAGLDEKYADVEVPEDEDVVIMSPDEIKPFGDFSVSEQKVYSRQFWFRTIILIVLVFFGYQTPALTRLGGEARREKIQDFLLGLFFGGINAYLIVGTVWSYMHLAHYPFAPYVIAPQADDPFFEMTTFLIKILPPIWLGQSPVIYLAIGLAFLFILVVFI